ncbi:MAG: fumarate hydratase [Desulfatitalea sp.]|nr:fumarate hydratase [Desulfatitalea sp.]NNK00263.1 fumarate hydratase [Desulfatitalea sp.]
MQGFNYQSMFPLEGSDETSYRKISDAYVSLDRFGDGPLLKIAPQGLSLLAEAAFKDVSHYYRCGHLAQLAAILKDPESSPNDRFVALEMLKNAVIAAEGEFPMCQDTGTAIIIGKRGHRVWTGGNDEAALARGVYQAYVTHNLRYSQNAPLSMYAEKNTGCNLPAQIDLYATDGEAYTFLMLAKGGGSANKTYLYQETKAVLTPEALVPFLLSKMKSLGTAACPPYHLAVVVGGTSAETTLKTVKLASAKYLDRLPTRGSEGGHAFRDLDTEAELLAQSRRLGIGAQFGGKYFCHDVRVIRLPRHGASCPIGIGVSCSADRNIKAKITAGGLFLEQLETDPARYLPEPSEADGEAVALDLNQPMARIRAELRKHPVATRLLLNGTVIVARDIAHAKLKARMDSGEGLPQYFKDHIIYYAGPAKTPSGYASGAFGPTTAGRMDAYVPLFQAQGASLVMLAKGNRSAVVTESCRKHGGFYLGSIGGPAARLGKECITHMEPVAFPELGMEAIYKITVKDFPAFILVDDKGNDFFSELL